MKAFKVFTKPFESPQRSVKMKVLLNFFTLSGIGTLRVNGESLFNVNVMYTFIFLKNISKVIAAVLGFLVFSFD